MSKHRRLISDILAQLGQARYVNSLDLKSGYWQVLMGKTGKEKIVFANHRRLLQFNTDYCSCNIPRADFKGFGRFRSICNSIFGRCSSHWMAVHA